jgi:hypothetical protein
MGLVVEGGYRAVSGGTVEADRLGQGAVGFQPEGVHAAEPGLVFEFGQDAAAEAKSAHCG